ncbi:uncharacterized protein B0P05DRAFT_468618 [Gilbertella persicaria]|uniref:uncharacterized protein n=1 Tax=Gilbertella persicaria TaxID=101096 RepID=UPI00221F244D|nr:uncharacterized protein B0P05DRAFT_468618 [Gilbertella persicaria]KAI8081886.1 hypothetical protein B0P05DRAFT_468618 [Gilbertella persicaria]
MAPDPTCQQCNEQFIEELQSDDDPRAFLSGTDNEEARNGHVHLPGGGAAHFFSYSPSTGRLRNLNQGDMGDDMFQYFTPRRQQEQHQQTEEEEEERGEGGGGGPRQTDTNETPSPLGNFVQSILTNMLGSQVDMENTNENENRPMIFLGNMVDGNMRFEPMPGRDMPGSMPRNSENEDTEQNEGANGQEFRGNSIAR